MIFFKRRVFLIFFPLLAFSLPTLAQQVIAGKITNEKNEPLELVTVGILNSTNGTISDSSGYYKISNITPGTCTIAFSCIGYERKIHKLNMSDTSSSLQLNIVLKSNSVRIKEVVVTGTLKETYLSDSPVHVEILTPKLFQKNPTPNLFEALQMINGVRPQLNCNVCNTGDIHINGMEGAYTMVLIDGMPIVSALSTVYGLSGIPNSIVDRIEVVKGPASTLYGSEAVAGLINVITKNPLKAPIVSLDVFRTSQKEYNIDLGYKMKLKKANTLLSANYFHFNNRIDVNNDNFTDVTLQKRVSVFNKWSFERKDNRLATLAARYVYEDRFGGELQWSPEFRGGDSIYGESIYTKRLELIGSYQLPLTEKITFNYSLNDHRQNSYYGTTPYFATQDIYFGQLLWDKKLNEKHDLLTGLTTRYTFYDDNTVVTQKGDSIRPENNPSKTLLPGIFIQDEISLRERQKLLLGARYDYHPHHGSIYSPRVNYKIDFNSNNILRFSAGNGFRVVNLFTEDHAALTGARKVIIKNELKPEQSYNININYNRYIHLKKAFIGLDATVFYTYFTNRITGDFFTDNTKIIYDNLKGYAISKGISINAEYNSEGPLKGNAGITLMDVYQVEDKGTEKTTLQQIYAPDFSGNWVITYKIEKYNLSLDYTGSVTGPMKLPVLENDFRPTYSPWFSIHNIQLTKKFKYGIDFYTGVKNIFNFIPQNPIMRPFDPFNKRINIENPNGYIFDPSYNYAPIQGIRWFVGMRYTLF